MIQVHEINSQPFIAERVGKRDVMHTLRDYCAAHQRQADQAETEAEELAVELTQARRAIEQAVVTNQPTAPLRTAADDLQRRIDQANRASATHRQAINEAKHVHDTHHAHKVAQAEAQRLKQLTAHLTPKAPKARP
jgi:hypothetical protein